MELDENLNPDSDDLPLRANTNHILVRHYVLDLTIDFDRKVIAGCAVLFLEPRPGGKTGCDEESSSGAVTGIDTQTEDVDITDGEAGTSGAKSDLESTAGHREGCKGESQNVQPPPTLWRSSSVSDFTLVLDCCDLDVSKVEEVDIGSVPAMSCLSVEHPPETAGFTSLTPQATLIQNLISMPSNQWQQQHQCYSQCSRAASAQDGNSLSFHTDRWSLQVTKRGAGTSQEFPRVLRIFYETRPTGGSVRWTKDQDNRVCVYTAGSPINNRALFPCQEPPVAMSTWQATVRAPSECVVLMSGEEQALPLKDKDSRFFIWNYHVTMPMPASTFTLAVGHWRPIPTEPPPSSETGSRDGADCEGTDKPRSGLQRGFGNSTSEVVTLQTGRGDQTTRSDFAFCYSSLEDEELSVTDYSGMVDDGISCSHGDYPCRFTEQSARSQRVIPHRVFAPVCLHQKAQGVLKLLPHCLAAAHTVLGVHPFPRLDVLMVPAGFSSLGMASPHIMFLSQSVLDTERSGKGACLCASRICHEIAHSWFGLVIGARDWTEEWISEGFATYLEDIIWAQTQKLPFQQTAEESELKALLRWRRLADELDNSQQQLQILRPNMESTGQVSESGSSVVKHALNPDKTFMQVHYLKGYFLLRFLASQVGEQQFIDFFRLFVKKYHGQLILSQDFLKMLLITFPDIERKGLTLSAISADWLDQPGIPKWLSERSAVWSQNRLLEQVKAEVVKWILLSQSHQGKGRKRKRMEPKVNYKELTSDQLVMLLELLLEETTISATAMRSLKETYALQTQDAEVRHRWCELVVKHGYAQAYTDVENFLLHDQAMGVYLYGELMVQEDAEQQALARRCLSLVQEEMDQSARRVVEEMIL